LIRINDTISEPISVTTGVKQGCLLSPTLFNLFINGLIDEAWLSSEMWGVDLVLLTFADDIALMADTEEDLQCMLNALHSWCECWLLCISISKTKVVHFRQSPSLEPLLNSNVVFQK